MITELDYALKWSWIRLMQGCRNPVFIWVAQYYSPGSRRIHALGLITEQIVRQIRHIYTITYSCIYTRQNTIPGTYRTN